MSVYGVWINNLDTRLPRIALFANRDISNGEEISFDYKMTGQYLMDARYNLFTIGSLIPSQHGMVSCVAVSDWYCSVYLGPDSRILYSQERQSISFTKINVGSAI